MFRKEPVSPGDRVVVRRRHGNHATDVIGHVVTLDPLVVRPQKVGGLPSDAEAIRIDEPIVVRRLSPRRIRNSDIRAVETATARAFPGQEHSLIDAWLARSGSSITERSNSATPIGHSASLQPVPIDKIGQFYRERGMPVRLLIPERIGKPALHLVERNPNAWELGPEIITMTRSLEDLGDLPASKPDVEFRIDTEPDDAWLDMYHFRGRPLPPEALAELAEQIDGELGFGRLLAHAGEPDEHTIAITRGTITSSDDGRVWLGYSAVEVAPDYRRQGLGIALGEQMLHWGASRGATNAYLQVLATNDAGIGLYDKLGFIEHHRHRYATLKLEGDLG
ncbi:GNAT family N-acetyltransferase [Corynebacterium appendicis]|uniref:N-acetylglutamate synthase, CG3035 family n=1 Tax=Corynebacterium appendicis TaxID=163202 RepID=UPI00223AFB38|nr:GNAT family N-acetyltransferase [Corynebacterium appendicis]MCT1684058.1 GNAT family N-acetyltransferase [Corynebacterium appendicis]